MIFDIGSKKSTRDTHTHTLQYSLHKLIGSIIDLVASLNPWNYVEIGNLIRSRQPRREIHLASLFHKVVLRRGYFILKLAILSARAHIYRSVCSLTPRPFRETLRPSRRSIRKVKLLPEINYLLIHG